MKGLLLKDFCLLKKQMKLMVVFVIFYAICAVAAKIPSMMGTMVILLSIMMPITSMRRTTKPGSGTATLFLCRSLAGHWY